MQQSSPAGWQTELAFQSATHTAAMSSTEVTRHQHALQEICRRLRSERRLTAPANGVVALVHSQQLLAGGLHASELGLSLRRDLELAQDQWQLQTPITLLVDGFESLVGTSELVRRSGGESAKVDGLGAAYPVRYQPEKHLVAHVCSLAFGQVEARIYRHLAPVDGLLQAGNDQLFRLLIACRGRVLPALQAFAGEAVGLAYPGESAREPGLFAGVHLVATGQKVTEQAWVKAALSQVVASQNLICWTSQRLRMERRLALVTSCLRALSVVLLIGLILLCM